MTTRAIAQTYTNSRAHIVKANIFLLGVCALALLAYASSVYSVVSQAAALREEERTTTALTSSVGELGSRYLELSSGMTPDSLQAYGLSQGEVTAFIPRSAATASRGPLATGGHEL